MKWWRPFVAPHRPCMLEDEAEWYFGKNRWQTPGLG